ncbi:MAG TPA: isoprenylcysteine carboxylmethyltransferase family protein [Pyrinomonadaceae bacterium]|nr:isoprenylcysteine carboxylmethyltransferase family protein [Pyrinomonadaceae bacterium]
MILPLVAAVFFAVTFVAEKIMLRGHKVKSKKDWDRSSLLIFDVSGVLSVPVGMIVSFTDVGRIHTASALISLIGIVMMLLGTALRWAAILTLRNYFTVNVTILENHQIVRRGLYRYLRHPSYAGLLLRYFGFGLGLGNWLSVIFISVPLLGAVVYRIHIEEKALRQSFGQQYEKYAQDTWRLVPKIY